LFGAGYQSMQRIGGVEYVGVGEPIEMWRLGYRALDSLVERPELAGPACRER
jgi:hypothetical protein